MKMKIGLLSLTVSDLFGIAVIDRGFLVSLILMFGHSFTFNVGT